MKRLFRGPVSINNESNNIFLINRISIFHLSKSQKTFEWFNFLQTYHEKTILSIYKKTKIRFALTFLMQMILKIGTNIKKHNFKQLIIHKQTEKKAQNEVNWILKFRLYKKSWNVYNFSVYFCIKIFKNKIIILSLFLTNFAIWKLYMIFLMLQGAFLPYFYNPIEKILKLLF